MSDLQQIMAELKSLRAELRASQRTLLGIPETADYLGLAPKSIYNSIGPRAAKPFPVKPVRVGGRVLFRKKDLDEFVASLSPEK